MRNNVLIVNNPIWKTYPIYIQFNFDISNTKWFEKLSPNHLFFNFFTLNILIEYFDISN